MPNLTFIKHARAQTEKNVLSQKEKLKLSIHMFVKKIEIWEDGSRKRHKVQIPKKKRKHYGIEEKESRRKKEGTQNIFFTSCYYVYAYAS